MSGALYHTETVFVIVLDDEHMSLPRLWDINILVIEGLLLFFLVTDGGMSIPCNRFTFISLFQDGVNVLCSGWVGGYFFFFLHAIIVVSPPKAC